MIMTSSLQHYKLQPDMRTLYIAMLLEVIEKDIPVALCPRLLGL
jgi:hypothetical protein